MERSTIIFNQNQVGAPQLYNNEFEMMTQIFGESDYCSLVSMTINDIYSNAGQLLIGDDKFIATQVIKFPQILNADDVCDQINQQQKTINVQFVNNQFQIHNITGQTISVTTNGNINYVLGLYDVQIINAGQTYVCDRNNSMAVKYIKLLCDQFEASEPSYYMDMQTGLRKLQFDFNTVHVLYNQTSYQASNLDIHMKIKINSPFIFRLLDQDNNPVCITKCYLKLQFYNKQYFQNLGVDALHKKRQMFFNVNRQSDKMILQKNYEKFSVALIDGQIPNKLFQKTNSQISVFECDPTIQTSNQYVFQTINQVDEQIYLDGPFCFMNPNIQVFKVMENICLYDEVEFEQYRDKFIDFGFFQQLVIYLTRVFAPYLTFKITIVQNQMQIQVNLNNGQFLFYDIYAPTYSILFNLLQNNQQFRISNLDLVMPTLKKYHLVVYDQLGSYKFKNQADDILNVVGYPNGQCDQYALNYTLSNILFTLYSINQNKYQLYNVAYEFYYEKGLDIKQYGDFGLVNSNLTQLIDNYQYDLITNRGFLPDLYEATLNYPINLIFNLDNDNIQQVFTYQQATTFNYNFNQSYQINLNKLISFNQIYYLKVGENRSECEAIYRDLLKNELIEIIQVEKQQLMLYPLNNIVWTWFYLKNPINQLSFSVDIQFIDQQGITQTQYNQELPDMIIKILLK